MIQSPLRRGLDVMVDDATSLRGESGREEYQCAV